MFSHFSTAILCNTISGRDRKGDPDNGATTGTPESEDKRDLLSERKARKEAAERNHIEGKFGQGKNGYNLNEIRARLKETSESWIACIFIVMNLIHYEKIGLFGSIFRWFNGIGGELADIFELPMALIELKYQSDGKSGGLQFG